MFGPPVWQDVRQSLEVWTDRLTRLNYWIHKIDPTTLDEYNQTKPTDTWWHTQWMHLINTTMPYYWPWQSEIELDLTWLIQLDTWGECHPRKIQLHLISTTMLNRETPLTDWRAQNGMGYHNGEIFMFDHSDSEWSLHCRADPQSSVCPSSGSTVVIVPPHFHLAIKTET